MDKKRNNTLIVIANDALRDYGKIFADKDAMTTIPEYFNGQVAALGVSVAMCGLIPTLAIYFKESKKATENKRHILNVIAKMIQSDKGVSFPSVQDARSLLDFALDSCNKGLLKELTKEVEDCSVALKQIIRTYKLS